MLLPAALAARVDGYGIDAFLLCPAALTATTGPGALSRCGVEGIIPLWQDHAVDMGEHG
jgi:hypothetical protein